MLKRIRMFAFCMIIFMLLSSFSQPSLNVVSAAGDVIELISSTDSGLTLMINVDWRALSTNTIDTEKGMFTEVLLPGWQNANQPGKPSLPFLTQAFGVPYGADLGVNVIPGKSHTITLAAPILPSISQVSSQNLQSEDPGLMLFDVV